MFVATHIAGDSPIVSAQFLNHSDVMRSHQLSSNFLTNDRMFFFVKLMSTSRLPPLLTPPSSGN